jgi:D-sedoheptulose 7-phosphate isomerase
MYLRLSRPVISANILAAVKVARKMQIETVVWTGEIGRQLHTLCECVRIPSRKTERIQECYIIIGYSLCGHVENLYFSKEHAK